MGIITDLEPQRTTVRRTILSNLQKAMMEVMFSAQRQSNKYEYFNGILMEIT